MIINNTGTFYVEGEYAQGDTILKAGDWELRANGSKNAFAYSPETFVRRNLLNWSEDLTKWSTSSGEVSITGGIDAPNGSSSAFRILGISGIMRLAQVLTPPLVASETHTYSMYVRGSGASQFYLFMGNFTTTVDISNSWQKVEITGVTGVSNLTVFQLRTLNVGDYFDVWIPQLEQAATPSDYQRTTTHVPRPFAIKDELWKNPTLGVGWVDNGDGSYTLTGDGSFSQIGVDIPSNVTGDLIVTFDYVTDGAIGVRRNFSTVGVSPISHGFASGSAVTTVSKGATNIGISRVSSGELVNATVSNISVKEVEYPLTLGNGNHKDFRYYPKTLSQNETEALTA